MTSDLFDPYTDDDSYTHVPFKPAAFTVHAMYKFIGKLKPRQFPFNGESPSPSKEPLLE